MATIQELEQAGANALAANNLEAAQYFADEIKSLSSVGFNSEEEIQQNPEGLVENAKFIADDVSNQLNNTIASIAGAPVDLISLGLNKVSNAIADRDIVPQDSLGGSESIRKIIGSLPYSGPVRDEPAKTKAGVAAQVTGEAITFTLPALKAAQVASKVQATSKAGQVGVNLAKQFTEEASKNTGRFLAVESGAIAGQSAGRILSEEKDLSPGATLAVELLTGITGALAGDKTFGVSRTLINKARGKTAQEIMESVAKGDITYKDLTFTPKERPLFQEDGTFNIDKSLPVSPPETGGQKIYYHGTKDDFNILLPDETVGRKNFQALGRGIYLTNDPKFAREFAGKDGYVKKINISEGKIADQSKFAATRKEVFADQEGFVGVDKELAEVKQRLTDEGFIGVRSTRKEDGKEIVVIFDSKNASILDESPTMPGITRQNFDEARGEIASNLLSTQRTQLALDAGNLNNYAPGSKKRPNRLFNRINSWLAPSKVVGREIMNEIDQAKGIVREAESVGIRAYNAVKRIKKANVENEAAIDENVNAFFLTGELDPSLAPIQTELSAWRSSTNKLRERLIGGMDDQAFMDLSPEIRESLRTVLEESMDTTGGYLTQPYRLFEDPNFKPNDILEEAAFKEIKFNNIQSGMSSTKAATEARKKISELKGNSAKTRELESKSGLRPSESENILRKRANPGKAEKAWLGEIKDPAERALITSRRLSRLASAKAEDAEIANLLLNSGVASRTLREGQVELKLKTVSGKTNIFVDPEVADSIYKLRYGPTINQGIRNPVDAAINAFFTLNFAAKFTKVVGNIGSYPVAALGSLTSAMSNGVMPNFSGMRKAAASFRSLENFVSGKSPKAKKEFYADLDKMDLYNLRPKSIDAADMEATLQRGFKILNKQILGKAVDIGGKAYSAFDVAMRYVTWKGTQTQLKKVFPDYTTEQIEAAAARMTNDTFPNYDKLSEVVRQGSRVGFFQPFIAHFAELSRISYNQGKFALQMLRGNFGKDFGLDPLRANKTSMRFLGGKRLAAFGLFTAGAKVAVNLKNEENGLDDRAVQVFDESVLPFWMDGTVAIIKPNKDNPRRGMFVPPEYAVPQIAMGDAFAAGFKEKPFEEYASILKGRIFSEGGSLALQTASELFSGYDERGKPIYIDPSLAARTKVIASTIYDDVIKPGTFKTIERFNDSINGIGDRTTAQNVQSLFGWRVYTYDADRSFRGKFAQSSSMMNIAKADYTTALRKKIAGDISQQELDATYNEKNTARRNRLDQARVHYKNMGVELLKYSLDEKIGLMKEGGLSSLDVLDILSGNYTDMSRSMKESTSEKYDNLEGDKEKAILALPDDNPDKMKLRNYHKRELKTQALNISEIDKLVISLDIQPKVDFLLRIGADKNKAVLMRYLKKDPSKRDVLEAITIRSNYLK